MPVESVRLYAAEQQSEAPQPHPQEPSVELTILMPCLNEAETLATCIRKAKGFLDRQGMQGEVLIADNGSTDGSQEIAVHEGARVIQVPVRGYGAALMAGIQAARGVYVIMGDADDSYDFSALELYCEKLEEGYELVMGNRFAGGIRPGAMPPLHRYLGNPVLSLIGRLFFKSGIGDFHCGLRGFRREAILRLNLITTGMEFASEMVVKATLHGLSIAEVPTTLSPDGRSRAPHLRTWRDGWRHLRFLLIYSPRWLFLYPSLVMVLFGLVVSIILAAGPVSIGGTVFDVNTLIYAATLTVVGFQGVGLALVSRRFATKANMLPVSMSSERFFRLFSLERGVALGFVLLLIGVGLAVYALTFWGDTGFGELNPRRMLRVVVPSTLMLALGIQSIVISFMLSLLEIQYTAETIQPYEEP